MDTKKDELWFRPWQDEVDEFLKFWTHDGLEEEIEELRPIYRPDAADDMAEVLGPLDS